MKILQAIYQFQTGGGSLRVVADLAQAARQANHEVTVLSKDVAVSETMGAERFFMGNKIRDAWNLYRRLQREQFDLIHVHDRYCSFLLRLLPHVPPSVQTCHLAYNNRRAFTRFADVVVGCSIAMDQHNANFFKLPSSRRAIIQNGVQFSSPDPTRVQDLRDSLPASFQARKIALTVARLAPEKGHQFLLEAIDRLPQSIRQEWAFVWAGGGALHNTLQAEINQRSLPSDLLLLGQTPDIAEWLSIADAFILPSRYEGLPLALMEAMAAKLPCLATDIDGNRELLHHNENGLLCPPANADALADALTRLLTDDPLRDRLARQAQTDYWTHWTFDRTWQQYETLYRRLTSQSPIPNPHSRSAPQESPIPNPQSPIPNPQSPNPLFSIVIPAYNASAFISDCIQSVLQQTESNFEVIVVDDGSVDNTAEIIAKFEDPRMRLIQRENGGLAAARNTGIAAAQGEWVAFLDADDRWCPEKLAAHRTLLEQHPEVSVSYDWAAFIDERGDRTGLCMSQSQIRLTPEALLMKNYLGNGSTAVVKRSVLTQVGGFDENLPRMVDQELWVRLTVGGHRFERVPQVLTEYRIHPNSFTADTDRMLQGLEIFLTRISHYAPELVQRLKPMAIAFTHRWMARAAFVAGNYDKARDHARRSLKASPQVVWRDPRAPITFAAIAVQSITPKPVFDRLLSVGQSLVSYWFKLRTT